jgi:hypothetical protein
LGRGIRRARDFKADLGSAEITAHIGLAEEIARRVTIVAAGDGDQIFAPFGLCLLGASCIDEGHSKRTRARGNSHVLNQSPHDIPP